MKKKLALVVEDVIINLEITCPWCHKQIYLLDCNGDAGRDLETECPWCKQRLLILGKTWSK